MDAKIVDLLKEVDMKTLKEAIRKFSKENKNKYIVLEEGLDELLRKIPKITLKRFKKEAIDSFKRVYGDEEESTSTKKRDPTPWNKFMKERWAEVKADNPDLSRGECMKILGEMWKNTKNGTDSDGEAPVAVETPASSKNKRTKKTEPAAASRVTKRATRKAAAKPASHHSPAPME